MVAVLPLSNMSGDTANDYLGAGLAESLITSLASVPKVTVLSRSAVEESRQQNPDRASFVRSLDASYIVTGSVQTIADRLRVTLNLERPDASVAWGETVEGLTERIVRAADAAGDRAGECDRRSDAVGASAPRRRRRSPATSTRSSPTGRAAPCSIAAI